MYTKTFRSIAGKCQKLFSTQLLRSIRRFDPYILRRTGPILYVQREALFAGMAIIITFTT
jgi:hypothetical protein